MLRLVALLSLRLSAVADLGARSGPGRGVSAGGEDSHVDCDLGGDVLGAV